MIRTEWSAPWLVDALDITERYWNRRLSSGADAEQQLWDWDRFRRSFMQAAEHIDFLLTPTVVDVAPLHRPIIGSDFVFTLPASLTGSPAIAIPVGLDSTGLPLSVQVIGRPWEDQRLLAAARLVSG